MNRIIIISNSANLVASLSFAQTNNFRKQAIAASSEAGSAKDGVSTI
jgi:hypothetical protein